MGKEEYAFPFGGFRMSGRGWTFARMYRIVPLYPLSLLWLQVTCVPIWVFSGQNPSLKTQNQSVKRMGGDLEWTKRKKIYMCDAATWCGVGTREQILARMACSFHVLGLGSSCRNWGRCLPLSCLADMRNGVLGLVDPGCDSPKL